VLLVSQIKDSLLHLAFPHVCEGCGTDILEKDHFLCIRCLSDLPATNFHLHSNNPIEKIFWGRLPLTYATSQYYFTSESLIQRLMHQFKYKNNKELGFYLGRLMGEMLSESNRFIYTDALVPLPLFKSKERKRGFNQATVICEGISSVMNKPVWTDVVRRKKHTESQTKKSRIERWMNMENRFELINPSRIEGKHIVLVDDVITTGATLEACGIEILKAENTQLSLATLCFSSH
jgi:ComF family protein